jgi:hypothetical protein
MTVSRAILILYCAAALLFNVQSTASEDQENPEILGQKILAIQHAIANPNLPDSMPAILAIGHDSRYYVMIRGWLAEKLRGDQSIATAMADETSPELERRIQFLKKAIRAIDLE